MALNTPRGWLITYDITNPKRLVRLHRFLVKQATPVQYSVFHFEGSAAQMGRLMADIETRIDVRTDDVRAYHGTSQDSCRLIHATNRSMSSAWT